MKMMGLVGALFFVLSLTDCLLGVALFNTVLAQILEGLVVFALEQDNHAKKSSYLRGGYATTAGGADHGSHDRAEGVRFLKQNETAMAVEFDNIEESGFLQEKRVTGERTKASLTLRNGEKKEVEYIYDDKACNEILSDNACHSKSKGTKCRSGMRGIFGFQTCEGELVWTLNNVGVESWRTEALGKLSKWFQDERQTLRLDRICRCSR
ncbi:unnamed protein product [Amoebophrya sp. A25]|nr:unnamed protein product [Amoebophrya sp. A25]|eukprot:GSA25T00004508001.1